MDLKKSLIGKKSIIPYINVKDPFEIDDILFSLHQGGLDLAEITYRNKRAGETLRYAIEKMGSKMVIGAGTILNRDQAQEAISFGARFIVSPGFSEEVYEECKKQKVPYLPGVMTPSEIMQCINRGIKMMKFFPAEAAGGVKTLRELHKVFPDIMFVPIGGINEDNYLSYLKEDFVAAVGGTFLVKGTFKDIEKRTKNCLKNIELNVD